MTHSFKRTIYALALAACAAAVLAWPILLAQSVMPAPKFTAYDSNGDPCNGCLLYAYAAGTSTPQDTYTDYSLGTPNANPVVLDSAGRATVFVDNTLSYKFTLKTSAGVDIWTQDNVVGQLSGVVTISAANTRGLVITRASADAGMSIGSTGGSGDTYAFVSTTAGELKIQDDTDGSPRFQLGAGEAASVVTTGTFTVDGGLLSVTGFGTHSFSGGGTGTNILQVRNSTAGTGNAARLSIGNDNNGSLTQLVSHSSTYTTSAPNYASGSLLYAAGTGGLSLSAGDATGDIRFFTGGNATARFTIDQDGNLTSTTQAGFLAYNSGNDLTVAGVATTLEFDTEVYDYGSDFNTGTDTFTAPVAGPYLLCVGAYVSNSAGSGFININTSNNNYRVAVTSSTLETHNGCVIADMDASDTASVVMTYAAGTADIYGGTGPVLTYFSGRLMP